MTEPKDASTCDERRVKNKLNLLTHKKKGETRTMSIQGTKHWKLGAFFVISLMLVTGLFSSIALAQSARFDITTPRVVKAEAIVNVTVQYYVNDPDNPGSTDVVETVIPQNNVRISLPPKWVAAYRPHSSINDMDDERFWNNFFDHSACNEIVCDLVKEYSR